MGIDDNCQWPTNGDNKVFFLMGSPRWDHRQRGWVAESNCNMQTSDKSGWNNTPEAKVDRRHIAYMNTEWRGGHDCMNFHIGKYMYVMMRVMWLDIVLYSHMIGCSDIVIRTIKFLTATNHCAGPSNSTHIGCHALWKKHRREYHENHIWREGHTWSLSRHEGDGYTQASLDRIRKKSGIVILPRSSYVMTKKTRCLCGASACTTNPNPLCWSADEACKRGWAHKTPEIPWLPCPHATSVATMCAVHNDKGSSDVNHNVEPCIQEGMC